VSKSHGNKEDFSARRLPILTAGRRVASIHIRASGVVIVRKAVVLLLSLPLASAVFTRPDHNDYHEKL